MDRYTRRDTRANRTGETKGQVEEDKGKRQTAGHDRYLTKKSVIT